MRHGKPQLLSLAIYPVIVSILFATLFYCLARWEPICGVNNFSNAETEDTLDSLSSFGGMSSLAKQLKDHPQELLFASLVAVGSFLVSVIIITFTLLCLYRHGWIQFIRYWLTFSTAIVFCLTGGTLLIKLCQFLCLRLDWLSLSFMMWNFSIGGVFVIFYHAPRWLQHLYLILMASLLSWLFRDFPNIVIGTLLAGLAIWDIYAVLSPRGPLRDMVELVSERGERTEFPALVYDTCPYDIDCIYAIEQLEQYHSSSILDCPSCSIANDQSELSSGEQNSTRANMEQEQSSPWLDESIVTLSSSLLQSGTGCNATLQNSAEADNNNNNGYIKIGLGDFVFYCVLVAKSSESNILTWFFCLCSVIVGFCWTLVLLLGYRKALPALPISICLGLIAYWISILALYPFSNHFVSKLLLL
ncbi:hypothetical protein GpartN1_g4487.t1 [Galdieria partita]|uniref:Presenilin n=1 Tax=Galdieria partita TaxID=83374 RepID=A0A9C7PY27_9RHOD|nr:hypothetical protein GpartN1_g2222.t1 [Galdieria partita]GJQ12696.1 hypothetical protein GpartN1_g4487.t1 [Galdieria partita]